MINQRIIAVLLLICTALAGMTAFLWQRINLVEERAALSATRVQVDLQSQRLHSLAAQQIELQNQENIYEQTLAGLQLQAEHRRAAVHAGLGKNPGFAGVHVPDDIWNGLFPSETSHGSANYAGHSKAAP